MEFEGKIPAKAEISELHPRAVNINSLYLPPGQEGENMISRKSRKREDNNFINSDDEDIRSIVCRQQHEGGRKARPEIPGVRLHRKIQCGKILPH